MRRILIFSDSRGQHKPVGTNHKIFAERLATEVKDVEVDLVLCPMKWTTTLDFFIYAEQFGVEQYDHVVLYTGIVEWSPRPQTSAINDLYYNKSASNNNAWLLNTRDYSKKIVNNKKYIFDSFFGEHEINKYLNSPFDTTYQGERTINMYSLDMAKKLASKLSRLKNIIFINANKVLSDWNGDYKKERPSNMSITEKYSQIFTDTIGLERTVDISSWSDDDVKNFTCDNIHLTKAGSDFIFEKLVRKMKLELKSDWDIKKSNFNLQLEKNLESLCTFTGVERFTGEKKRKFLSSYTTKNYLGTLIIGLKIKGDDNYRIDNLNFLLSWIDYHYSDLFEVLIVEQGQERKLQAGYENKYSFVKYEFLYNPNEFNRGWGYNVAVQHFCKDSKVVALIDTDVLTGNNFVADFRDCFTGKYKVVSPYQNVYYTSEDEAKKIKIEKSYTFLNNKNAIKNPVTLTGGIVIFDRRTYLSLKGFEQYVGYGCEDRSLDVLCFSMLNPEDIRISPYAYPHLYHPTDSSARVDFKAIYQHLQQNYNCSWSPKLDRTDFIHNECSHPERSMLVKRLLDKELSFADPDLYKNGKAELTVNGIHLNRFKDKDVSEKIILPPDFKDFNYLERELYEAPAPDSSELEQFRNAFLGERCFIIGNGPSLNKHDLSLLENEYSFGVNSFYYKTRETGFTPTFYVVEDNSVMKENLAEIKKYHAPFKFFPTVYKRLHPKEPNTFFFEMNRGFYEKSSPNYCIPRFSADATKQLFCGQSVTYINLQLAYFMGFSEVYLIGMDFSYVIPDSHKRTGDVLLSDSDDPNHFHKDYFGKGKTWKDPKLERVGMNYRMAKIAYESTGRKIYNATVGGSLEIFERKNYYDLFDNVSVGGSESEMGVNFADANRLYRNKQFADAAVSYLRLAKNRPEFSAYREMALVSWSKAKENNQPLQDEVRLQIIELM